MNNPPEEIRVVEQRGPVSGNSEDHKENKHTVLVKRIVPIDEAGNIIKYGVADSGRKYNLPAWSVRGHYRTLPDGREIYIHPYLKDKERKNQDALVKKEYQFDDEKIDSDVDA